MSAAAWENDPVYHELADAIASDRLVVYTGSGISNGLERANGPMPSWKDLLAEVAMQLQLSGPDRTDVDTLLRPDKPLGAQLIEAASILERVDEAQFSKLVREKLTPLPLIKQTPKVIRQQTERHDDVIDLQPCGIITLNIDRQHAEALNRRRLDWKVIDPTQGSVEVTMRDWLGDPDGNHFLLEAHGSLQSKIVFTHRAYRDLLEKNPVYRAFLGNLFINYRFLFLGFGLTDLDFDELLNQTALTFGESPRHHIVVRKAEPTDEEQGRKVHYRRRFGLHFLDVPNHDDVWTAIRHARSYCGPELKKAIESCVSTNWQQRREGHRALSALGPSGRSVAIRVLTDRINIHSADVHMTCEYIYSLKYLASTTNAHDRNIAKNSLFQVLEQSSNIEYIAHAITALEAYLEAGDLHQLEKASRGILGRTLTVPAGFTDPDSRVPVYLEAAILRLRASGVSGGSHQVPPRPGPPLVGRS